MPTIWLLDLDDAISGAQANWLSPDEHAHAHRFVRPLDAQRYRVAHVRTRELLAEVTGHPPPQLKWATLAHGKPVLEGQDVPSFNLSHSQGWGALAIGVPPDPHPVGVDIECMSHANGIENAAEQFMSALEWSQWQQLPPGSRAMAALCCWTRKEAALKAVGCGLHIDPRTFSVGTAPAHARLEAFAPGCAAPLAVWSWRQPEGLPVMLSAACLLDDRCSAAEVPWQLRRFRATSRSGGPV
jgi:4'-phosphopantetheinyl transferase